MSKKVIRIISFVLVVVTLLSFIIPYVSATELDKDGEDVVGTDNIVGETPESLYGTPPEGFELIVENDYYRVQKHDSNMNVWFQIPITNETPRLQTMVFVVDIEKNMVVEQITLNADETYVNGLKLDDGYYALITGNYAFGSDSQKYEINAGKPLYFYIGDTFLLDQSKYGVAFNAVNDSALQLTIDVAKDGAVLANGPIDKSTVKIPEEITKMTNGDIVEVQPNTPTPEKPTETQEDKPAKPKREFFLITIVKDSWIWLVLLAACAIVYKVMENKKKEKKEKYIEADRNDSGRFE